MKLKGCFNVNISKFNPRIAFEQSATLELKSPLTGEVLIDEHGKKLTVELLSVMSEFGRNKRAEIDRKAKANESTEDDNIELLINLIVSVSDNIETDLNGKSVKLTKKNAREWLEGEAWVAIQLFEFAYKPANFEPKN